MTSEKTLGSSTRRRRGGLMNWGRVSALGLSLCAIGCGASNAEGNASEVPAANAPRVLARGLLEVGTEMSAEQATVELRQALNDRGLGIPLDLDHQAGAQGAGLQMPPSTVFVFGNPMLGTPLMQENILVALDLPLKMVVSENAEGAVTATYEGPDHLRRRHSLSSVEPQLQTAAEVLAALGGAVSGGPVAVSSGDASGIEPGEGMAIVNSRRSAAESLAALTAAIESNAMLSVFAQIDHQAAAQGVGLELDFATLVIFGSPAVGTPLMVAEDSVGLDLPLKMLVAEREGQVVVAYSTPEFLARRHGGLASEAMRLAGMGNALANLAAAAAGRTPADATAAE